ncbi:hypothetical protein ASE85_12845 [Sphingobium sp. Leaf26]|nr:hypothetical protein ASE85_12845 [Sphingobium sp. Leaf26]
MIDAAKAIMLLGFGRIAGMSGLAVGATDMMSRPSLRSLIATAIFMLAGSATVAVGCGYRPRI